MQFDFGFWFVVCVIVGFLSFVGNYLVLLFTLFVALLFGLDWCC